MKRFLTETLTAALAGAMATPADLLHQVTPDVLSTSLPRPLWARLITAALASPTLDARLVVDTLGIGNLCEHLPTPLMWTCLATIAGRALGQAADAPARVIAAGSGGAQVSPFQATTIVGGATAPAVALASSDPGASSPGLVLGGDEVDDALAALSDDGEPAATSPGGRNRSATRPPPRVNAPPLSRMIGNTGSRRPQVPAPVRGASQHPAEPPPGPAATDDPSTAAGDASSLVPPDGRPSGDSIDVDDEQLVEWSSSEETNGGARSPRKK